jgi:multidrug resistance protein, MATE family
MMSNASGVAADPYSHQAIWAIAAPMILCSVTVPLVGLVGTGVIGHLDDPVYLAGVAASAQIFAVLFTGCNFLRMGTTGITAQAWGAADGSGLRRSLVEAGLVAVVLGLLFILLQTPLREAALGLLGPEAAVGEQARAYFDVRIWSAPATLLNFVALGWLLGLQNARGPLALTLLINLSNMAFDLWLVLGLGWQVRGVATGALVAEYLGAGLALWLVARELRGHPGSWVEALSWSRASLARLFQMNGNLLVRTLSLMFVFSFVTAQGARLGAVLLAANALLMNFQWLLSYVMDGLANAAEALVGRAVGGRDAPGLERAVGRTLGWSLLFACVFTVAFWVGGGALIDLLTDIPEIRTAAREYLPWLVLSPLISVWSFFYDGVYVGTTRSREMRVVMTASAFLVFLPAWFLTRSFGNHGLWFAFTLFMAVRGLGMHLWYRHQRQHAPWFPRTENFTG